MYKRTGILCFRDEEPDNHKPYAQKSTPAQKPTKLDHFDHNCDN